MFIPVLFGSEHQGIGYIGIFSILSTIPIILFILIKKTLKIYFIIFYLIYFFITIYINIVVSVMLEEIIHGMYTFDFVLIESFSDRIIILIFSILFILQFPVIILCLIIKRIYNYKSS